MWSTSGVLQQPRRLIATLLQSLLLSFGRIPVEDQSTVHPKDRSCFSRRRRCSRKQDSHSTGAIRRFSQDGMHKKDTEIHWQCTMLAKKKSCFSIASLFKDDFSATRAERLQNAKHWVLRLNADGHQKPLRQRPEFAYALKQCFEMQDAHLAQSEGGENFDYYVDRKTGWRYYREREPRGNPQAASSSSTSQWPTSQWQTSWNSWQPTSSEKWWWFRFPGKNSRKSTERCRQDTHSQYRSVLCSLFTSAERIARAWLKGQHGSSHTDCSVLFARLKRICHLVLHMSWSLVASPAVYHEHLIFLIHSSLYDTRTRSTIGTTRTTPRTLSQSTSCAIKNHSGVKTCRVAETRARQLPQVMSPKSLRLSQGSKIILEIHINYMVHRKNSEKKITEPPITEEVKEFGEKSDSWRPRFSNIRDVLLPIADAFRRFRAGSDLEDGELQKMLTSPLYAQKASGKPDAMVVQEREVSAQYTQADRKGSLRPHSSEGQKALVKPNASCSSEQRNLIRSSVFRNGNPSNLRGSLLEGNKDHLLDQARSDLAIHSSYEGALIDGLPADKSQGWRWNQADERSAAVLVGQWVKETDIPPDKSILLTGWARRMKGSEVRSRCVLKDFATTVRDDVFAPTPSPLSVRGLFAVRSMVCFFFEWKLETLCVLSCKQTRLVKCSLDLRKDKNVMDGSGDYMERHANGKPWLYRIPGWCTHRAHGFQTWQTGAMSVCARVERNTSGISWRWPFHVCQASNAWKILDADHEVGRDKERRSSQPPRSCGLPGIRVPKCTRRWTQRNHSETYRQVHGRMLGHCSTTERKSSDDAFDGTEELESIKFNVHCSELLLGNCNT